ncbi:alpha/beta hydrolase [Parapedobacter sp. SGR-10]|uniref:alpha/beta hydrolase n=1 Tax=Parapedobacter sp. SGR-10 TaxID=2710879 RepID=UPI0013D5245C|nr:alpha/beta hydrolase [Parapedobacter sp. SGR-10]NGF57105.1 alpha/beta hydrolase [Parapedobacter sp. SGR-10]
MRSFICTICAFLGLVMMAEAQITEGKGYFEFSDNEHLEGKKMRIFYYRPTGDVTRMPILFVMHGMLRNADVYRDNWVSLADKHKVLVIVPEFSNKDFPGSRAYNYGNVLTKGGNSVDEKYWSYSLIDPIFDYVVKITDSKVQLYDLFGHSAGSQFAHRFFLFNKDTKANRVVASNAGSYMVLDQHIAFPWGLKGTPVDKEHLRVAFAKQLVVQLGENDNDPNHHQLPKGKEAMKQGEHRFERGQYFFKTAREVAEKEGMSFNWSIRTVPGVGHQNGKMAVDAAEFLYGGSS